jgi:hypothetical protein
MYMNKKIESGLYQFSDEKALLVVTGKQNGRLFFANKGNIKEVDEAFIPTQRYSDDEGFFGLNGGGHSATGSPKESKDVETKHKFMRVISAKIKKAIKENDVDCIYLFSPNYEITELKETLPKAAQNMIKLSFMGNFVKFAPDMLLTKISAKMEKKGSGTESLKPEERKIMRKPKGDSVKPARASR